MRWIDEAAVAGRLNWTTVADALEAGHRLSKPLLGDQFLNDGEDILLSRSAWVPGMGVGVKSVTVTPANPTRGAPTVQGAMLVFGGETNALQAVIDSAVVTKWKTAGDSVLGARLLARPDSRRLLIIGAGAVAESLIDAYAEVFPGLQEIRVWNRTRARAETLVARKGDGGRSLSVADDLETALGQADIVATATLSKTPVLRGDWIRPGAHVDLIGAFTAEMREADDALLRKAQLFVDSFETTLDHIGELKRPLEDGVIARSDVLGDFYDLVAGRAGRAGPDAITVFKNGGGAHLDLMTAQVILRAVGVA